jgi:transposase
MKTVLGIDQAKKKFDVALLRNGKYKSKVFENNPAGFAALLAWLAQHGVDTVHACMEATSTYGEALARFLHEAGHSVSVTNPARIKAFGKSELLRTKNDKIDAKLIARFCETMKPTLWQPAPPEIEYLRGLGRRRDALVNMRTQELNRKENSNEIISTSIQTVLDCLDKEIELISKLIRDHISKHPDLKRKQDLLNSIPGVGPATIEAILSEINAFEGFETVEQVVAYMGLSPKEHTSGSSVKGKSAICKIGNARLRKALYMPALSAMLYNPIVKALYKRMKEKSKNGMVIACACMKKLVHLIYGVIKSNKPFDPAYTLKTA